MSSFRDRALRAYFRAGPSWADTPADTSGEVRHDGRDYVVLHNVNGVLAVYRIKPAGKLRRLRRWPPALEQF